MILEILWSFEIPWHDAWIAERRQSKGEQDHPSHCPAAQPKVAIPAFGLWKCPWHNTEHVEESRQNCHRGGRGYVPNLPGHNSATKAHCALPLVAGPELFLERFLETEGSNGPTTYLQSLANRCGKNLLRRLQNFHLMGLQLRTAIIEIPAHGISQPRSHD